MYGPEILDLFDLLGPLSLGATAESWAQDGCWHDRFRDTLISVNSEACSCDDIREVPCTPPRSSAAAFRPLLLHVFV